MRRVAQRGDILLTCDGTAGIDVIRRAAGRLAVPVRRIEVRTTESSSPPRDNNVIPERDRAIVAEADEVLALGVRADGNIYRALRERLLAERNVVLVALPDLQSAAAMGDLIPLGAIPWEPEIADQAPLGLVSEAEPNRTAAVIEVVPFPAMNDWDYLSHSTRSCPQPWPGQTQEQYIDSLLDNTPEADHSRLAALERIVTQRRLFASHRTIRGGYPMVCLTSAPLQDLPALRRFRSHRTRWDFEPFGLCIRRDWLLKRGARPVVYGNEATWTSLHDQDRPFFQWSDPESGLDWSVEREWRHPGDLDLSDLPVDQGLVFVPNYEAATRICPVSPWPVTLWPGFTP